MPLLRLSLILIAACSCAIGAPAQPVRTDSLLARAQKARNLILAQAQSSATPVAVRMQLQLRADGNTDLRPTGEESRLPAIQLDQAITTCNYDRAPELAANTSIDPYSRRQFYRWLFLTEDLKTVESRSSSELAANPADLVALVARAEFLMRTVQYDSALAECIRLETMGDDPDGVAGEWRVLIHAQLLQRKNKSQEALEKLAPLFDSPQLSAEAIYQAGVFLIRLGRTHESIDLFEEAVRWNPAHELAHYYLGNGYARLNYHQLADSVGSALKRATSITEEASRAWQALEFRKAREQFEAALEMVPAYGRAHNGLAKALEALRMRLNVYRREDEAKFDAVRQPEVPGIDNYVLNWNSLSPRHQKQVALAVAPWKEYIPLLVESGSQHFIKPLHYRLSECPGIETLKDQRISYDSRLWDDVRGCGGYTTVTGIEDVERSIYSNYNTVLHELTHQVHGCFPPEDIQRLDQSFETARKLDDGGTPTFMSRYQASSVWEYFAEGAHAYYSPRRNELDTREITRERLFELDTMLVNLVEYYVPAPNHDRCWPVGLINAADDRIERQQLDTALVFARKAQARAPHAEVVLEALSRIHSLRDEDTLALIYADTLIRLHPEKGRSYMRLAGAVFTSRKEGMNERIDFLHAGLMGTDTSDRKRLMQSLGDALYYAGRYDEARAAYQYVLDREPTDYGALWGVAASMRHQVEADSFYRLALKERTGIADLRCAYGEYLLETKRIEDARAQLKEAELLAPKNPNVLTLAGMLAESDGNSDQALTLYERALQSAASPRLAAIKKAALLRKSGERKLSSDLHAALSTEAATVIPAYVYDPEISNYVLKNLWPAELREMLSRLDEQN